MAVKTRAQIAAEIAALFADNTTGDISASDLRTVCNDIVDSYGESLEISGILTAAQINLLDTTPITLINAQGTNTLIVIENSYAIRKSGTAYTTTGEIIFAYDGGSDQGIIVDNSSLIQTNEMAVIQPAPMQSTFLTSGSSNKGIQVKCSDTISGGTGDIYYTIKYKVINFN